MASNIREFTAALDKFEAEIPDRVQQLHQAIMLEAHRGLVLMTPVDSGRARANWQVTRDQPAAGELEVEDKGGAQTLSQGATAIAGIKPYSVSYITNNVPYIEELENGHSQQAPRGMLNVTFTRLRTWLRGQQ